MFRLFAPLTLLLPFASPLFAGIVDNDAALPADAAAMAAAICGKDAFRVDDEGIHCERCPAFTGDPDGRPGLDIGHVQLGHFSGSSDDEAILDTSGCEAHYENFGGAILLRRQSSGVAPAASHYEVEFYAAGYRLDDCVNFEDSAHRNLLACNEQWVAQGENVGFVSIIEVNAQTFVRWRLFQWYDNSATLVDPVLSIMPVMMQAVSDDKGRQALEVGMRRVEGSREAFDANKLKVDNFTLRFEREGQRFFADAPTRHILGEINSLTHVMSH
jgi:hypothetical protein